MLASASGSARSTARRSRPAGKGFLRLALPVSGDARPRGHEGQEIADVNDAFGIVEGFVVDHEARMRRALEQAHQFAERDVALDRDDVGAMDHHVGDAPFMQAEDVAQHGALDRGKADLVRRRGIEHDLQIVADRSRLPAEQRADRADQPVVGGRAQHLAVLHHRRQIARVARIVVGRFGVRHLSPSAPDPHTDRECRVARGSRVSRASMVSASVVVFVIVADQMQETVDRQMAEMMVERLLFVVGFLARGLIGDGDVAEHARRIVGAAAAGRLQRRKRQHVGRLVDAAPVAVQGANAGIVGQHHREFGFAGSSASAISAAASMARWITLRRRARSASNRRRREPR